MTKKLVGYLSEVLGIINLVRESSGRSRISEIDTLTRLREDLGFDSLELAELTVRIQAAYQVDVFAKRNLHTVGDILEQLWQPPEHS